MAHLSLRLIPGFIAVDPGAIADVDIFQISEMGLVKQADFLKNGPAVNGRAPAGGENLYGAVVIGRRTALAPGERPAQHSIVIPCILRFLATMSKAV